MTDKQLGIFVRQLSRRLRELAQTIEPTIIEGQREIRNTWIGDGPEPTGFAFIGYSLNPVLFNANYAMRPTGRFIAVTAIEEFADQIEGDALELLDGEIAESDGE